MNVGSWAVNSVEILANKRVRVVFTTDRGHKQDFVTGHMGLAGRAKAAELAKFVVRSGLISDVIFAYRFIRRLPRDYHGPLLFEPIIEEQPTLSIVS